MTFVDLIFSIHLKQITDLTVSLEHVSIQYLLTPPLILWSLRTGGSYKLY